MIDRLARSKWFWFISTLIWAFFLIGDVHRGDWGWVAFDSFFLAMSVHMTWKCSE